MAAAKSGLAAGVAEDLKICEEKFQTARVPTKCVTRPMSQNIEIAAFYKFAPLPDFAALRLPLLALCDANGVKGMLLLAHEGINGTLAGTPQAMAMVLAGLRGIPGLEALEHKTSFAQTMPFLRMKVRLKAEIVTLGEVVDPRAKVGTYVEPQDWDALIANPDVLLIDARNGFEISVGSFIGALDPQTRSFGDFPAYVRANLDPAMHKKVAMFCTGGIRCEKASSFMLGLGFAEVFHLKGGILNYLEKIPAEASQWSGNCFVFDDRVAVGHALKIAATSLCHGCRRPLEMTDRQSADYEEGVTCPHCVGELTWLQKASARERQRQIGLSRGRGERHLGPRIGPQKES